MSNGAQALEWLALHEPDVVVLDVSMPHVDGLTVCRVLRSEGNGVPILMVTARTVGRADRADQRRRDDVDVDVDATSA